MRQLLQERWTQTLAAAIETSSTSTRVAFSVAIGVAGLAFVLLVLWKLRRKLGCCSGRAEQVARQDVLRLAAELYSKQQHCESSPRLQLPAKLRNAALAQPDMELRIKAAVLPSAPQPPTAFQQPRDHWGFPLALDCGAQPCSPVGPVTQQCREEGRAAVRSADALLWQHCGETSSGCITPRAGRPPTTSVQGGSSAASPQASCSATLSDTLSQGTLPAASPRARSPPTAPTSPPPPCTDTQHGSDASPTPSSLGLTWAELGVSQPSSPTAGSGLETRLHRLASYLRGGPAERGTEPQPGGPSRLHSRLGDHSLSYASSPESASQLVLPGSHQASSMYTGAEKPPALPSPPWLEVNGGTACGSTSKQWLLGLEEGAEEGRG